MTNHLASFVSPKLPNTFGEFRQLASSVSPKNGHELGEFRRLANFVPLEVGHALGQSGQLANFRHTSVPGTWRVWALGELAQLRVMWQLARFDSWRVLAQLRITSLGMISTWLDFDLARFHLGEVPQLALLPTSPDCQLRRSL